MSRQCELTGKKGVTGNNVSHSNRKTKRWFFPNLQIASFWSDVLLLSLSFRVAASTIRTVEFYGGIDCFLIKSRDCSLSNKARRLKRLLNLKNKEKKENVV